MTRAAVLLPALAAVAVAAPPPKGEAKLPPPTAEQLKESQNNLKQILLAMHNYHDAMGRWPNNTAAKDGTPLLSWRVQLLPYLEEDATYRAFKQDEPWNSEANKKLLAAVPKVYAPIRVAGKEGHTFYRGFDGPGAMFEKGKRLTIAGIPDGTSNTIAVVEAGESVEWTKPDDLPFGPGKDLPKLGGLFDGVFHAGLCDGSVRKSAAKPDAKTLRLMIDRADGTVIDRSAAFPDD